ncbi:DUF1651 domain-containing protein [Synechococcus sp. CCY9201]|uniref:DUF1651 domain-containing protein n=1 Tax=Synechococcus sp. CCY9201 TaxID=174697 RepID=UPI002B1F268D|nr:DUF1651 domain-containing protein [Synechococcus sp. CCY9201]MEA5473057.1 DUF1651 domain-containing protein [Synechococcus sp. CCY9201]
MTGQSKEVWRSTAPASGSPDHEIPLLKPRRELRRAEALKLWAEKRKAGWAPCTLHQAEL